MNTTTIKDVAKAAGVSHTTVSRALSDSPLISEATKMRLKALAEEMGYRPNLSARGLKLNKAFNYGLFFSTLESATTHNFVAKTIQGVRELLPRDYRLTIEGIKELESFDGIQAKNYDGILVVSQRYDDESFLEILKDRQIKTLVLNRDMSHLGFSSVFYDDEAGMAMAVDHLVKQGARKIGFIKGLDGFYNSDRRLEGYQMGLGQAGMGYDPDLVVQGDFTIGSGYEAAKELVTRRMGQASGVSSESGNGQPDCLDTNQLDALICSNDEMAIGAMKALEELLGQDGTGLKLPLVGFDDVEMAAYLSPSLTTVRRDISLMARQGVSLLTAMVEENVSEVTRLELKSHLILRKSG